MKKKCRVCKEEKGLKYFAKDSSKKDRLRNLCKDCDNKKRREYRRNNKEKLLKKRREREKRLKEDRNYTLQLHRDKNNPHKRHDYNYVKNALIKIKKRYGCCLCETKENIVFHHISKKTKNFTIGNGVKNLKDTVEEIKKCIPMCNSCHTKYHMRGEKEDLKVYHKPFLKYLKEILKNI